MLIRRGNYLYTNKSRLKNILVTLLSLWIVTIGTKTLEKQEDVDYSYSRTVQITVTYKSGIENYGTGLIYNNKEILTVAHLFPENLDQVDKIEVKTSSHGKLSNIEIDKIDLDVDLACLNYTNEKDALKVVKFKTNKKPNYGEHIYYFGNPSGYGLAYRQGYISKSESIIEYLDKERNIFFISNNLNKGESGSPIFDENNNFLGIASFKLNDAYGNTIDGFSGIIPISVINNFVTQ